ncbi:MAG: hypothetical protein QW035_01605 [Candidatus Anstonellales archaeon]
MWEKNKEIAKLFTSEGAKKLPIYNWFYYKEAFSPQLLDLFKPRGSILDPFSGSGTTALWAKLNGQTALGIDAFPLAVFIGQAKTKNYSDDMLSAAEALIPRVGCCDMGFCWKWEAIVEPKKAIPKRNLGFFLRARAQISKEWFDGAEILLLALLSSVSQCSLAVKDGGVLRTDLRKSALPAKDVFRRKAKRFIAEARASKSTGKASVVEGDARMLGFQEEFDWVFTSPPYLNAIDYQRVYSLEAGLLGAEPSTKIRSYLKAEGTDAVSDYFCDMEKVMHGIEASLKRGGRCALVVGNAVIAGNVIEVDKRIVEASESIGLMLRKAVYAERVVHIGKERKKARETLLLFEKK